MADYHSPTVIQPGIPHVDMTLLERLLLTRMFDSEPDGDGLYFFSETGPCNCFELPADALREAFAQSAGIESEAQVYLSEKMAGFPENGTEIEIDFSGTSWEFIFQDIVRRSQILDYVTVISAFTCTKMRSDGFGGMATLITAEEIKGKSTNDILGDFLEEFRAGKSDMAVTTGGAP